MDISLSKDGSAMVINGRESLALCHMCNTTEPFDIHIKVKPKRWFLMYGGTPKSPKRFFICSNCSKTIRYNATKPA